MSISPIITYGNGDDFELTVATNFNIPALHEFMSWYTAPVLSWLNFAGVKFFLYK